VQFLTDLILNTYFRASVLQCGFLSEQFDIQRGCRQGDPIAPYLFILRAEILAILIKQNKNIKGICINNTEHKISQYADDPSLALTVHHNRFLQRLIQ
jgi:hypothetical protein